MKTLFRIHKQGMFNRGIWMGDSEFEVTIGIFGSCPSEEEGLEPDDYFALACIAQLKEVSIAEIYDAGYAVSKFQASEWGEVQDEHGEVYEYLFKLNDVQNQEELEWIEVSNLIKESLGGK